jgi:hypothetical protein
MKTVVLNKSNGIIIIKIKRLLFIFGFVPTNSFRIGISLVLKEGEGYDGFYIHLGNKNFIIAPPFICSRKPSKKKENADAGN